MKTVYSTSDNKQFLEREMLKEMKLKKILIAVSFEEKLRGLIGRPLAVNFSGVSLASSCVNCKLFFINRRLDLSIRYFLSYWTSPSTYYYTASYLRYYSINYGDVEFYDLHIYLNFFRDIISTRRNT